MKRQISWLVVHCTATPQYVKPENILKYWKETLKWKALGYHKLIDKDGNIHTFATDDVICNGVKGFNKESLHVSYIGGVDMSNGRPVDNRTLKQKEALIKVLKEWKEIYPYAIIKGHRDFEGSKKACPSFDAKTEYTYLSLGFN